MSANTNIYGFVANGAGADNGFSIEQKTLIDQDILNYLINYDNFWDQFFDVSPFIRGRKKYSHRKLLRPEVTANNLAVLVEGKGTYADELTVSEWEEEVFNRGAHVKYTKEALQFNIDSVVEMISHNFSYKSAEIPQMIEANAMMTSNFTMSPVTDTTYGIDVIATFDNAKVILDNKKSKPWKDGRYLAVITTEIERILKKQLRAIGEKLDQATVEGLTKAGTVYEFDGFYIVVRTDKAMYGTPTATSGKVAPKIGFFCYTEDGEKPGSKITPEIYTKDKGLGSGLITDPVTDELGADTNDREGVYMLNIDHLGVGVKADLAHLICACGDVDKVVGTLASGYIDPVKGATSNTQPTHA